MAGTGNSWSDAPGHQQQRQLLTLGQEPPIRGPELAALLDRALLQMTGLETRQHGAMNVLPGAPQIDGEPKRRRPRDRGQPAEDRRPPEIAERSQASGIEHGGVVARASHPPVTASPEPANIADPKIGRVSTRRNIGGPPAEDSMSATSTDSGRGARRGMGLRVVSWARGAEQTSVI